MRKIFNSITILLIVLLIHFDAKCQNESTIDLLSVFGFDILPNGAKISNPTTIFLDSLQFIKRFGKPKSVSYEKAEMFQYQLVSDYKYRGLLVSFLANHMLGIDINNPYYVFKLSDGSATIKVGDNTTTLRRLFPNSWRLRKDGKVFVQLKNKDVVVDCNLLFEINKSGIITAFSFNEDNS
jgi:hypothetical protein